MKIGILLDHGVPDEAGIDCAELDIIGDIIHGALEDQRVLLQGRPLVALQKRVAGGLANGGGIGIGLGDADLGFEQIGD